MLKTHDADGGQGEGSPPVRPRQFALLDDLDVFEAFYQEHPRCGELDGGVYGDRGSMTCSRGAVLVRVVAFG